MKEVTYQPRAVRALGRMPRKTAVRIVGKIEMFATDPASQSNNVTKLQGRDGLRLRVGDYRVIIHNGEVLDILDVGPRGGIYS